LIPAFGIERDAEAYETVSALFPNREIVAIEISDIALGGGGIHCITQQQPKC
jgi:agmatine deiminase